MLTESKWVLLTAGQASQSRVELLRQGIGTQRRWKARVPNNHHNRVRVLGAQSLGHV